MDVKHEHNFAEIGSDLIIVGPVSMPATLRGCTQV